MPTIPAPGRRPLGQLVDLYAERLVKDEFAGQGAWRCMNCVDGTVSSAESKDAASSQRITMSARPKLSQKAITLQNFFILTGFSRLFSVRHALQFVRGQRRLDDLAWSASRDVGDESWALPASGSRKSAAVAAVR